MQKIGILGAGAWGTALAQTARRAGRDVTLWAREPEVADAINRSHENALFLPGVSLDEGILATTEAAQAVRTADAVLLVAPAQHLRAVTASIADDMAESAPLIVCAKGIEQGTGALLHQVVGETLPGHDVAVLSGPTFAAEVARGMPTAVTVASTSNTLALAITKALATPTFRIYPSNDPVGAEIGGAVKNVLAIGCGIVDGRGLGDNARAALITRGLAEIARLTVALGGKRETLMGLAGLGDITLTCNAMQSRNYSLGIAIGQGRSLQDILAERRSVAEGVATSISVSEVSERLGVDMPIAKAVAGILHLNEPVDSAIQSLLSRPMPDAENI